MYHGWPIQYELMARYCNTWRNYEDVQCNAISKYNSRSCWDSVSAIRDYWGGLSHTHGDYDRFVEVAGPGQWNDAVRNTRPRAPQLQSSLVKPFQLTCARIC